MEKTKTHESEISVEERLRALFSLQLVDSEIDKIKTLRGELPLEVQDLEDEIVGLETRLGNLRDEVTNLEKNVSKKNNEIADAEGLIKNYPIYYYPRPDTVKPTSPVLENILMKAKIHRSNAPLMDISGTFIRNGIKHGKDMSYFLAPPVWKYIKEMHFYER